MDEYSKKYLFDVLTACEEVESFFSGEKILPTSKPTSCGKEP